MTPAQTEPVLPEFAASRLRAVLGKVRGTVSDPMRIMTLSDALAALGEGAVRDLGQCEVPVERIVGTVGRGARVHQICTIAYAMGCLTIEHLPSKAAERLFLERVPLPDDVRTELWLDDPTEWLRLADAAEAWAYRNILAGRELRDRGEFAHAWWTEEVEPAISRLRERGEAVDLRDVQAYVVARARRNQVRISR
jgi:hypothetical protein